MRDIIRYLTKNPRIRGVNGFGNWKFADHVTGKFDGKKIPITQYNGN